MPAYMYVDRFDELRSLPMLRRLELLDRAEKRMYRNKSALFGHFVVGLALAFACGLAPRLFLTLPMLVEGLLLGFSIIVATQYTHRAHLRLLRRCLREELAAYSAEP